MKLFLKILICTAIFFGIQKFCHLKTDGFRVYKIKSYLPYNSKWETESPNKERVQEILKQKFHYLGSGLQCYAFESNDRNYVLKVFKHHHMRPVSWLNHIPLPKILDKKRWAIIEARSRRVDRNFTSYKIANDHLKDETGTLYVHLNKTVEFEPSLTFVDKIGIEHVVDPNSVEFVLQKKARLAFPTLQDRIDAKDIDGAKECLDSLIHLILNCCKKGIAARDPMIFRNIGYIGNQAIEIDLGSFVEDESLLKPPAYKKELFYQTQEMRQWLKKRDPELFQYFNNKLIESLHETPI